MINVVRAVMYFIKNLFSLRFTFKPRFSTNTVGRRSLISVGNIVELPVTSFTRILSITVALDYVILVGYKKLA